MRVERDSVLGVVEASTIRGVSSLRHLEQHDAHPDVR